MKRLMLLFPALLLAFLSSATLMTPAGAAQSDPAAMKLVTSEGEMFSADMKGSEEVPAVDVPGEGSFTLFFDEQAQEMRYLLNVIDMNNITAAHLHMGMQGQNGDVVVNLNTVPGGGETEGVIRAGDLVGPMAGKTLMELADEMEHENIYVNVHTQQNPKGEIRGQVRSTGGVEPAGAVEED